MTASTTVPAIRNNQPREISHARLGIRLRSRECRPVVPAKKQRGARSHARKIEGPCFLKRVTEPKGRHYLSVNHAIDVRLAPRRIAGVKIFRCGVDEYYAYVARK